MSESPNRKALILSDIETTEQFTAKIGEIMRLLSIATRQLRLLSQESVSAEAEYKRQYSIAVLQSATNKELCNAELRKAHAELESLPAWQECQTAKFRRENCREWMDTLKKALVAIQSIGAGVRAEMQLSGIDPIQKRGK